MDYLPIQGSAVPCERVFSSSKETTTARCNRINTDLMEALQMLKYTLRNGAVLNFTAGTSKEEELRDLEIQSNESAVIPEDINAFIQALSAELVIE
ncbi:hypothetical protein H0H93_004074 [Arthromyces matolae]|nr:hypothetical protein H0H93_004074 [Arthromyces matolae]